jgi:hypothetical protein
VINTTTANVTSGRATTFVATNFSSGNAVVTGGSVNNSAIGNSTPSTGAFTTLTSSGATTFTNATQSDNPSTGAVVVTGGLGVGANLNVAGNVTVTGNLLVLGNTTTLNVETLNVEDLNITVAANATSGAEANGAGLTVAGANATLTYLNADDSWNLNKKLNATTVGAAIVNITTANITTNNITSLNATRINGRTQILIGDADYIGAALFFISTTGTDSSATKTVYTVNGVYQLSVSSLVASGSKIELIFDNNASTFWAALNNTYTKENALTTGRYLANTTGIYDSSIAFIRSSFSIAPPCKSFTIT